MAMYYSERKKVNEGSAVAPVYHTGERDAMERQFHLNCANILDPNNPRNDLDVVEWGTIENGVLERRRYTKPAPAPEEGEGQEQAE